MKPRTHFILVLLLLIILIYPASLFLIVIHETGHFFGGHFTGYQQLDAEMSWNPLKPAHVTFNEIPGHKGVVRTISGPLLEFIAWLFLLIPFFLVRTKQRWLIFGFCSILLLEIMMGSYFDFNSLFNFSPYWVFLFVPLIMWVVYQFNRSFIRNSKAS